MTLMLVHVSSKKNVTIDGLNILFERKQNRQQYRTKTTGKEVWWVEI